MWQWILNLLGGMNGAGSGLNFGKGIDAGDLGLLNNSQGGLNFNNVPQEMVGDFKLNPAQQAEAAAVSNNPAAGGGIWGILSDPATWDEARKRWEEKGSPEAQLPAPDMGVFKGQEPMNMMSYLSQLPQQKRTERPMRPLPQHKYLSGLLGGW